MKFQCWIKAEYDIPDRKMREVVEQFRKNWEGENVELHPHDLIQTARNLSIGRLSFDSDEGLECEEPPLTEADLPKK